MTNRAGGGEVGLSSLSARTNGVGGSASKHGSVSAHRNGEKKSGKIQTLACQNHEAQLMASLAYRPLPLRYRWAHSAHGHQCRRTPKWTKVGLASNVNLAGKRHMHATISSWYRHREQALLKAASEMSANAVAITPAQSDPIR